MSQTRALVRGVPFTLLVVLIAACGRTPAAPRTLAPDIWATVDDRSISRDDVERTYRLTVQPQPTPPSDEEALNVKLNLLEELINQDLLVAKAAAGGLQVTDGEVDAAYAEQRGTQTDAQFLLQLSQRNATADDVKRQLRRSLLAQKLIDRDVAAKIAVTDTEITAFYNQNRAQFNIPEQQYRIAQIVITPVRDAQVNNRMSDDASTPAEAARKAEMLVARLKAGADFGPLAMDYSEDPQTAAQGGDLGFVPASALDRAPAPLKQAVLRMQPGTVTTVPINGAFTILMLVSREAAGQREVGDPSVQTSIRDMLRGRKEQVLRTAYLTAARNDARVVNNLARLVVAGQGTISAGAK
jgi:peptidyl-prolyl cis-trans isomerase SurA